MTGLFGHLEDAVLAPLYDSLEAQARAAECFETPPWAARAILGVEILTHRVVDPCCGTGVLAIAAMEAGYDVSAYDLHDWGYPNLNEQTDFLAADIDLTGQSIFMNPPFSLACEFVDHARRRGARKILSFQRLAWRETDERRRWWARNPPARIWLCGNRATCWRFDLPPEKRKGSAPTAHAWFVWEQGHRGTEAMGVIYRSGGIES